MNIFLFILALFIIKNYRSLGKVFYENTFLLGSEGWIITGNKLEDNTILHQHYSLQQRDNNCFKSMTHYITAKDNLINVDAKNKDDKNLWYFKSPPIKLIFDKTIEKPILLMFTLTSFMGDFRNLNYCHALIKINSKCRTFFYPYVIKYDGNMMTFNIPLRNDLWYNEDVNRGVNFDTIFDDVFEIEIFGDWTQGVEVIGLDNVLII